MAKNPGPEREIEGAAEPVTQNTPLINFEAVIRRFGPQAISALLDPIERDPDVAALRAINTKSDPDRAKVIRSWLQSYGVFQGISGPRRIAIAEAFLQWADSLGERGRLTSLDQLCNSHDVVNKICEKAFGGTRDFTSLSSKALWLCYPEDVPLFDGFAERALLTLSKLESGVAPLTGKITSYRDFAHTWKALYARYETTIVEISRDKYDYPVRVFDRILWIIGIRNYGVVGSG